MTSTVRGISRCISILVICALVAVTAPMAEAKPLTAETVHTRIVKRGIGNWVGLELLNGTAIVGRIVSAGPESFGLQLHNDPTVTEVRYEEVVKMNTGISNRTFWGIMAAGIGGVAVMAVVGFHEVHSHSEVPTVPSQPTTPLFP